MTRDRDTGTRPRTTLLGRSYTCDFPEVATHTPGHPYKEDDVNAVEQEVQRVESPAVQAPVSNPTKRDVLHRAADLLEEFGWCQGSQGMPHNHKGRHPLCFTGSIVQAMRDFGLEVDGFGYTDDAVEALIGQDGYMAALWNDRIDRTRAEVVARLREAAERSEHE